MNPVTNINGAEYELSTKLMVAYKVQGYNNHKPYTEVFQSIGDMTIEKQIEILYAAFQVANPEVAKEITQKVFFEYYMNNYNLKQMMSQLQDVIKGVLGEDDDAEGSDEDAASEGN